MSIDDKQNGGRVVVVLDSIHKKGGEQSFQEFHKQCSVVENFSKLCTIMKRVRTDRVQYLSEFWKFLKVARNKSSLKTSKLRTLFNQIESSNNGHMMSRDFSLKHLPRNANFILDKWQHDEDFIIQALKKNQHIIHLIPSSLWEKKSFVERALTQINNVYILNYIPIALGKKNGSAEEDDMELPLLAIQKTPNALQYCSVNLRNNKEFVMKCLGSNFTTMMFVGESLIGDVDILLKCLSRTNSYSLLKHVNDEKILMKQIVKRYPLLILRFYKHLKDEFQLTVNSHNIHFTKSSIPEHCNQNFSFPWNLSFVSFIEDVEMARVLLEYSPSWYNYFPQCIREDVESLKISILKGTSSYYWSNIPEILCKDRETVAWVINNSKSIGSFLDCMICEHFPEDAEFLNYVLKNHFTPTNTNRLYLPYELRSNKTLCRMAMKLNPHHIYSFDRHVNSDEELIYEAIETIPKAINLMLIPSNDFIVKCWKKNRKILEELRYWDRAIKGLLDSLEHFKFFWQHDSKFVVEALQKVYVSHQILDNALSVSPYLLVLFPNVRYDCSSKMGLEELIEYTKKAIMKGLNLRLLLLCYKHWEISGERKFNILLQGQFNKGKTYIFPKFEIFQ